MNSAPKKAVLFLAVMLTGILPAAIAKAEPTPSCAKMYDVMLISPSAPESKLFVKANALKAEWEAKRENFRERTFAVFEEYFERDKLPEIKKNHLNGMLTIIQQTLREGKKKIPPAVKHRITRLKEEIQEAQLTYHENFIQEAAEYFRAAGVKYTLVHFQDGSHTRNVIMFQGGLGKFHPELRSRDRLVNEGMLTNTLDPYSNLRKQSLGFAGHAQSTYGVDALLSLLRGNPRTIAHENIHNIIAMRDYKGINPHRIAFNDPAGQIVPDSGYARRMQADERITHAADGARVLKIVLDRLLRGASVSEMEKDLSPLMKEAEMKLYRAKEYNTVTKEWTERVLDEKWERDSSPTDWSFIARDKPEEGVNTHSVGGRNHPKYDINQVKFRKDPGEKDSPFVSVPVSRSLKIPPDELGAHVTRALEYLLRNATSHLAIAKKNLSMYQGLDQLIGQLKKLETANPQKLAELMAKLKAMPGGQRAALLKALEACQAECGPSKIESLVRATALPRRKQGRIKTELPDSQPKE